MNSRTRVFLSFVFIVVFVVTSAGQTQRINESDSYQLGPTLRVRIPSPQGFVDTFSRFRRLKDRFLVGQEPGSILQVHVPAATIRELEQNEDISLTFYSRVSAPAQSRMGNATQAEYLALVAGIEKQFDKIFDAKGPVLQEATKKLRTGLDKHYGTQNRVGNEAADQSRIFSTRTAGV